jgi:hypothetical protein
LAGIKTYWKMVNNQKTDKRLLFSLHDCGTRGGERWIIIKTLMIFLAIIKKTVKK